MIELKNVSKKYGNKSIYENINLTLEDNKITAILGENGSGKTTIIRVLMGLTEYDGVILGLPKKISCVFQEDRLIPNLTVKENILLVNKEAKVDELLESVGLKGYENKSVTKLSGGKKRKVAIARALSYSAPLMIFDEPFSSVDIASKEFIRKSIKKAQREQKNIVLYITHDIDEAVEIADRIIVLSQGGCVYDNATVDKIKTKKELYNILMKIGRENINN